MSKQIETNAKISGRILTYVSEGATIQQAMTWVLGPGYYEALVEELYVELRAKAGAA